MKRKSLTLLILVIVLAVAAVGYALLSRWTAEQEALEEAGTMLPVLDLSTDDIQSMTFQAPDGTEVTLTRTDDGWGYVGDAAFPLDQSFPEDMLEAIGNLTASQQFEAEDLSDYGLTEPSQIITLALSDETEVVLTLGDENDLAESYYLQVDGGTTVSMVDSALPDAFDYTLMDMVQMEEIPEMDPVESMTLTNALGTFTLRYTEDPASEYYTDSYSWFAEDGHPAENSLANTLKYYLLGLSWTDCIEYNAADLSLYGLDSPAASFTIVYQDENGESQSTTLLVGGETSDGSYYAMLDGSTMVYTIQSSTGSGLCTTGLSDVYAINACSFDWDTVEKITIEADGESRVLTLDRTTETDEDGETSTTVSYTLDGEACDTGLVSSWLTGMNNLSATERLSSGDAGTPDVTITFTRNSVEYEDTTVLTATAQGEDQYLVSVDGGSWCLIPQSDLDELLEELDTLIA